MHPDPIEKPYGEVEIEVNATGILYKRTIRFQLEPLTEYAKNEKSVVRIPSVWDQIEAGVVSELRELANEIESGLD